jgi:hypothetical protein
LGLKFAGIHLFLFLHVVTDTAIDIQDRKVSTDNAVQNNYLKAYMDS